MKEAQRSLEVKEFNKSLQLKLECKSSQQFSKYKRKCKRVNQLAEIVGRAGATLLSIYVTIFMLENAKDMEWNQMLNNVDKNLDFKAFCMTVKQDDDMTLPIFV